MFHSVIQSRGFKEVGQMVNYSLALGGKEIQQLFLNHVEFSSFQCGFV